MTQAHYRVVEVLGRGGMGEVCLAEDLILQRQVALKFLTSSSENDVMERLFSEARAAAALDHPFICSIYEVTELNGRPCIVMEYVRGETLERRLRRAPPELAECLRIADEIAEALEAAHNRGVIHSDLKPANVMLTEGQHIKVMDFGLATRIEMAADSGSGAASRTAPAEMGVLRGTPAYMAPEQIRGETTDRRSDIFSCGILLYELLSGTNPFARMGLLNTLAAITDEPIVNLHDRASTIPKAVSAVVAQMLAKDPRARYQSFGSVRRDLRRLAVELAAPVTYAASVVVDRPPSVAPTLVGRDVERSQLVECIERATSKSGSMVLLSGEAGMGKTRLAEDALNAARRLGCQTLVGRCYDEEGTPPLIPYIAVLEQASRLMPAAVFHQAIEPAAPELAKLLPELYRLFPAMAPPLELPPSLRQRFLFTTYLEFLARCSGFAPIVIFIDDLQWADESTLQLTQHLAEHVSTLPIVVVAAYRDIESAPSAAKGRLQHLFERVRGQNRPAPTPQVFKASLDRLVRERHARLLVLRAFSETEVRRMLSALGSDDPPSRLVATFVDHTGGNPFFVAELFRHLNEEGRLFDAGRTWKRGLALESVDVPDSVRGVLELRLQRVSDETQKVLKAAAVIGPQFELELLEAVADVDSETVISALEESEQARLLRGPSGRQEVKWRFAHRLICQLLTSAIPQVRRQRLHVRIAEAMVRLDAPLRPYTSEIAHHLYCAGHMADPRRTARALITAGDAARDVYATEEAIQHYMRALEVLQAGVDEPVRVDVEERLADLLALVGEPATAMTHYEALAGVHEARQTREAQARIARKIGILHWHSGDRDQAMASYRRALEAVDGLPALIERAHLSHEIGLAAFRSGHNEQAIEWAELAVQSAEKALAESSEITPDTRREATTAIAHATNTIGVALARCGQLAAAREHIERSLNAAREAGLLDVACRAYANLGVLYSTVEPKRAIDVSVAGLELAAKMAAARLQSYLYANLAAAYCALTDRCETEGLQAARAAVRLDRELGQLDHLAVPLIVMAQIHQCRGELGEARQAYDEALALAEKVGEPQLILPCYDGLATICLDRGEIKLAEQYMEKAQELCQRTNLDPDMALLLPFLC